MEIEKSETVAASLASRNIGDAELLEVIRHGEDTGQKFYHPEQGLFLAYKRLGEASYYVLYSLEEPKYIIHSAYWHKSELKS